jgi:hypothetical protein
MTQPPMPVPPTRVSAVDAAQQAIEHVRAALFPFRFDRWLALGFLAFLEQCGRGGMGNGGSLNVPGGGGGSGSGSASPEAEMSRVLDWMGAHVAVVAVAAALVLALIVAITALVLWVGSRATFMYMDDVATGRADVRRPWREHAERANSLFAWRFVIGLATLLGAIFLVVVAALLAFMAWKGRMGGAAALAVGLLLLLPLFLVLVVSSALVSLALRDFVAPLQWELGLDCGAALRRFVALLRARPGVFAAYVLLKIAFSVVAGIVVVLAGCLTCCCAFLPVISQTVLQPLFFFERAWSLCLMRQLGHDVIRVAPREAPIS